MPSSLLCMCCYQTCEIPFTCKTCINLICFICLFQNQNSCLICGCQQFKRIDPIILSLLLKIQCQCNYCGSSKKYLKFSNHTFICDILSDQLKLEENFKQQLQVTYENCQRCKQLISKPYQCLNCSKIYCQKCLNSQREQNTFLKCQNECLQCKLLYINQSLININQNTLRCLQCNQLVGQYNLAKHLKSCQLKQKNYYIISNNQQDLQFFRFPELILNYQKFSKLRQNMEQNQLRKLAILVDKRILLKNYLLENKKLALAKIYLEEEKQ